MSTELSSSQRNKFLTFPYKLWQLMDECNDGAITWNATGESIVIDQTIFCTSTCVKKTFKSIQWKSFVRQLNMYGFHKITSIHQYSKELCQCQCHLSSSICYSHEHFRRRNFESLTLITRPRKNSRSEFLNTGAENSYDVNDNASQTLLLTIEDKSLENEPQDRLIEPTVPMYVPCMLMGPDFNSLDLPKETSIDPNPNAFSNDFNVIIYQSFITHSHVVPSMNAATWTEITSSEICSSQLIATDEIPGPFLYFSQSDATGQVLRAIPEFEISFDDGVESMEIDDIVVQDMQLEFV